MALESDFRNQSRVEVRRHWERLKLVLAVSGLAITTGSIGCPTDDPELVNTGVVADVEDVEIGNGVDVPADASDDSTVDPDADANSDLADVSTANWACLGDVEAPNFRDGSARGTITVAAFPGDSPLTDILVKVCDLDDRDCDSPLDLAVSDDSGVVELDVPTDVAIFYQLTGGLVVPSLFFRRGLPPEADPFEVTLGALTPGILDTFSAIVSVTPDPARGNLVITGRDCDGTLAAGLSFDVSDVDDASTLAYIEGVAPNLAAEATDSSGRAGVLNLVVGDGTVSSSLAESGQAVGSRTYFIEAGWTSFVGILPD